MEAVLVSVAGVAVSELVLVAVSEKVMVSVVFAGMVTLEPVVLKNDAEVIPNVVHVAAPFALPDSEQVRPVGAEKPEAIGSEIVTVAEEVGEVLVSCTLK